MIEHTHDSIALRTWLRRVVLVLVALCAMPAFAAQRVALVIGNADYEAGRLSNPVNDASAVKARLEALGFRTIYGTDLNRTALIRKLQEFRDAMRQDGVALVFYSGHGVEVNGTNYMLPIDNGGIRSVEDVEIFGVAAQNLVSQMEAAGNQLNVVILDACRDNPLPSAAKSSASKGLGQMHAQRGTLIAYATAARQTAADGRGRHSPYTEALLRWLGEPGLEVGQVFNRIGLDVSNATGGVQVPWVSTSPIPTVMLAGAGSSSLSLTPVAPSPAPGPEPAISHTHAIIVAAMLLVMVLVAAYGLRIGRQVRPGVPGNAVVVPAHRVVHRREGLASPVGTPLPAGKTLVLGRDPDCDLVFARDQVSARHARIGSNADGSLWVEDLDSANGVWLGQGQRLPTGRRVPIEPGQTLYLADQHTSFQVERQP